MNVQHSNTLVRALNFFFIFSPVVPSDGAAAETQERASGGKEGGGRHQERRQADGAGAQGPGDDPQERAGQNGGM